MPDLIFTLAQPITLHCSLFYYHLTPSLADGYFERGVIAAGPCLYAMALAEVTKQT
jgi:hypothetical protein